MAPERPAPLAFEEIVDIGKILRPGSRWQIYERRFKSPLRAKLTFASDLIWFGVCAGYLVYYIFRHRHAFESFLAGFTSVFTTPIGLAFCAFVIIYIRLGWFYLHWSSRMK